MAGLLHSRKISLSLPFSMSCGSNSSNFLEKVEAVMTEIQRTRENAYLIKGACHTHPLFKTNGSGTCCLHREESLPALEVRKTPEGGCLDTEILSKGAPAQHEKELKNKVPLKNRLTVITSLCLLESECAQLSLQPCLQFSSTGELRKRRLPL